MWSAAGGGGAVVWLWWPSACCSFSSLDALLQQQQPREIFSKGPLHVCGLRRALWRGKMEWLLSGKVWRPTSATKLTGEVNKERKKKSSSVHSSFHSAFTSFTCPDAMPPPLSEPVVASAFCARVNDTHLSCPQVPLTSPGIVPVQIKVKGNIISPSNLTFLYYRTYISLCSFPTALALIQLFSSIAKFSSNN